jgi:hypothetical protein
MITYDVTYRYGRYSSWVTRTMSPGEYGVWYTLIGCNVERVVIPRGEPKRITPAHPKRYGGQLEGHPIKSTHLDRWGDNCRQFDRVEDTPPMRRTDIVALQSGGLSPAEIMAKAKR